MIDDGSTDDTVEVARAHGVDHLVRLTNNKGLAAGFQAGHRHRPEARRGRDRQHRRRQPVLRPGRRHGSCSRSSRGARTWSSATARSRGIEHFSALKKAAAAPRLVGRAPGVLDLGADTTSGFRAYNREAAIQMLVVSKFTYTLETIIQAGKLLVAIDHVPVRTNPQTRESRLFPSMGAYVRRNALVDLPHLRPVRAAARVLEPRAADRPRRDRACGSASRSPTPKATARATSSR